jgi:hypothetical protein
MSSLGGYISQLETEIHDGLTLMLEHSARGKYTLVAEGASQLRLLAVVINDLKHIHTTEE